MPAFGPYAIKTANSNYAWIRFVVDEKWNITGYQEATDFKNNQWSSLRPADQLPAKSKFSVYDPSPDASLHQFCIVLKKDNTKYSLARFPFRKDSKSGSYLPLPNGETFKTILSDTSNAAISTQGWVLDFNEKAKAKGITSNDYWQPEENELKTLNQTYKTWQISTQPKWHNGSACSELDFKHDDLGNDKLPIESNLTSFQRAQVEGMLFHEWNPLKAESKSSEEYCQALSLIMTGSLSDEVMDELNFSIETQANAPVLRHDILPSTIDKLGSRFYDGDDRPSDEKSTIADVHQYVIKLMQQEINQYDSNLKVNVVAQIPNVQIGKLSIHTSGSNPAQQFRNDMQHLRSRFGDEERHVWRGPRRNDEERHDVRTGPRGNVELLATQAEIQRAVDVGGGLFTAADLEGIQKRVLNVLNLNADVVHAALREQLFTAADFARITSDLVAVHFVKPECIAAIREGLFTAADFARITSDLVAIYLVKPECIAAIREGLFTAADFVSITNGSVASDLIKPECLAAIREGLFTAADFVSITDGLVAFYLIKPECLAAIRENRTTIDQLLNMTVAELSNANTTGEYPNAPRLGM